MPQVIVTEGAAEGLERCWRFLAVKAPDAAKRAGQAIERQFLLLETAPDIGRPFRSVIPTQTYPNRSNLSGRYLLLTSCFAEAGFT